MSRRKEILELYKPGTVTSTEVARRLGVSDTYVRGAKSKARKQAKQAPPAIEVNVHVNRLKSWTEIDDTPAWKKRLKDILHSKPDVTVMHHCDIHFPEHDPQAYELLLTLTHLLQPDIVVIGSDQDDNRHTARFIEEGDAMPASDFLMEMAQYRMLHTANLRRVAPSAALVNIEGNHGFPRFYKWVNKNARGLEESLYRQYVENVRCDGRVFWIKPVEYVAITPAFEVHHGLSHTIHAAHKSLQMLTHRVSIMAGHTHRIQTFSIGSGNRSITAVTSGCIQSLPERYVQSKGQNDHQNGTAYAIINTRTGEADITNSVFHREDKRMRFYHGGKRYEVSK